MFAGAQSIRLPVQGYYILCVGESSAVGAAESLKKAEITKDAGCTIPLFLGDFALSRFILHLSRLEDVFVRKVKTKSTMESAHALKAAKDALKTADKLAPIKVEVLKLMGIYHGFIVNGIDPGLMDTNLGNDIRSMGPDVLGEEFHN